MGSQWSIFIPQYDGSCGVAEESENVCANVDKLVGGKKSKICVRTCKRCWMKRNEWLGGAPVRWPVERILGEGCGERSTSTTSRSVLAKFVLRRDRPTWTHYTPCQWMGVGMRARWSR